MTNLTKAQRCIKMRDGIEIWVDEDKVIKIQDDLINGNVGRFITINGSMLNVVDITGIYRPEEMEDVKRRKNGEWKCKYGVWHTRGQECDCRPKITGKPDYLKPIIRTKTHKENMQIMREAMGKVLNN